MNEYNYDYILNKDGPKDDAALKSLDKFYGGVTSTGDLLSRL